MSVRAAASCALAAALLAGLAQAEPAPPFRDPELPAERRLDDLLSRMTRGEKVACLGSRPNLERLGLRLSGHVEGLHGLALGGPGDWGHGQPVPTTTFPQAVGLAETWDVEALRRVGALEGYEARYVWQSEKYRRGGLVVRAPNADLARDPRWGRAEESFGEDAFLAGSLAAAFIQGLQGQDPRHWQAASLMKHFLANSNENGRSASSSDFDERQLREYYSVPFRMGVLKGGSRCYMAAYNAHNGVPCTVHPMLQEMTIREWGLDGIICTDAGALRNLVTEHRFFPDIEQAAAASLKAGITQFLDRFAGPVEGALARGLLDEADLDRAVRRNLRVMLKLGLLDPPGRVAFARIGADGEREPWLRAESRQAVREVTRESAVLLKNEGGLLPLDRQALRSLALVGPRADEVLLDWYSGTPPYAVTPLAGLREALGPRVRLDHAADDKGGRAAELARRADVAVVVVGNHTTCDAGWEQCPTPSDGKEAVDRAAVDLEQEALVRAVHAANPRTVVVLLSSFPFAIRWTQEHVPAILHLTHNSQELGHALADVLFGEANPAGRLVHTWPRSLEQLPPILDYDLRHGRTYQYFRGEPLYPFGFGLSYATFAYSAARASAGPAGVGRPVTISVDVRNAGTRAGDEVVQLYVRRLSSSVPRPRKELRGFQRVPLRPGETRTVAFRLGGEELAHWDVERHAFRVEAGSVEVQLGASSADIRATVTVPVEEGLLPPTGDQ